MPIASDFEVQNDKDIRYTGVSNNYTVLELHRWLQDLADDASSIVDDIVDITSPTPTNRQTDNIIELLNGFNIDATAAEHLYDGSIIQAGGDVIWDGLVVLAPAGTRVEVIQNGALLSNFWTTSLNPDAANGISHRFMVQVRTGGADIDGRRLLVQTRELGFQYSEFRINGTARGNNVAALAAATDLNNQTAAGTIATWSDVVNITEGYNGIDADGNGADEFYYSEWDLGSRTKNQFYERMKWLTRRGSASTIYGLNGELFRGITHEIDVVVGTGTFNAFEPVSWPGGTGQLLAINNPASPLKIWIQLLTGVAPTDTQTITGGTSGATCTVDTLIQERPLSFPFIGASTGSAIIGGYGVGIESADLGASDRLFDLTNTQRTPPNNVTFSVGNLVAGGSPDRVLVGPAQGGVLDVDQFTLNGALTGAAVTAVVVNGAIPADTPQTGTIRVQRASGIYSRIAYTSWTGSTFTIGSTDFSGDNANNGANCFISYIDKDAGSTSESFTVVYNANRDLFIRVRNGKTGQEIKTFETTATLTSAGGSATAIRTSDA